MGNSVTTKGASIVLAIFTFLIIALMLGNKVVNASGQVEYCYVSTYTYHAPTQPDVVVYDVWGYRNWRPDRTVAQNLKSLDDAKDAATKYGCQLR